MSEIEKWSELRDDNFLQKAGARAGGQFAMATIIPSPRVRPSPFYQATLREGVTGFTPYNQMLMPTGYGKPEEEYWRLINDVAVWDVAVERQVELVGPDAATLTQILCPRDMSKCKIGQGKYVPLCNHAGTVINDPIVLKLEENRFWLSLADSNILLWARAVAAERGLDVTVYEPDVSPLAVQGPKAEDVVASLFGDWIRGLKYFWFKETTIQGIPVAVARSGWSKQGGFEIYLMDSSKGDALWNLVREAGVPFNMGPGNPNQCERVESGLLSYGVDTDDQTNPFEVRMGKYVDLDVPDNVIGIKALRRIKQEGVKRQQLGVIIDDSTYFDFPPHWQNLEKNGQKIGSMVTMTWSYRLGKMIGLGLVSSDCSTGEEVTMLMGDQRLAGKLVELPFL